MANVDETSTCCGVLELHSLVGDPKEDILDLLDYYPRLPLVYFTDNTERGRGKKLAAYIKKHKLGPVVVSGRPVLNPNSGNKIQMWVWTPNYKRLDKIAEK